MENIDIGSKERKYIKKKTAPVEDSWPEFNGLLFHEARASLSFTPPFPSCLPKALAELNGDSSHNNKT